MNFPARYFIIGIFFCAALLSPSRVFGQDQYTEPADQENPYLEEEPTTPPKPTGSVLQAASPQLDTFVPGEPSWIVDAEVTQVGRNAERARQFIYWTVTHPLIYKVPQIQQAWFFSLTVAGVLVVFVIIGLALSMVLSARRIGSTFSGISFGMEQITLQTIIIRVVLILVFLIFSYSFVRLFIEAAEITSKFFIERLGGQDLFNILYSGSNQEDNYAFVGYKNADPLEQDMVSTSLLLVRLSSFTYNFMSVIIILRQIVLMFLLIISPFLALLLPFIFIRNTGYIWIAEFFRWLLYGPLFALFLSSLARIWKAGIPFEFAFKEREGDMVYQTGVNILYGGPAQTLSPTNTGNYVDTYAEYIIGLIMLWVAILLPWLLLRIFRDYCCDILERNGALLSQILDKMRMFTPSPPPGPAPVTPTSGSTHGRTIDLPFRTIVSEKTTEKISERESVTRERVMDRLRERDVSNVDTRDIQRAFNLQVSSIKDVARLDTRKDTASRLRETLERIQNPLSVPSTTDRQAFENLRTELTKRAASGDQEARALIQAATYHVSEIPRATQSIPTPALREAVNKPGVPVTLPGTRIASLPTTSPATIQAIADKTKLPKEKVQEVVKAIPLAGQGTSEEKIKAISQKTGIDEKEVQNVVDHLPKESSSQPAPVTIEEYEEVRRMWMNHYRNSEIPMSGNIKSRFDWVQEDIRMLTNTINLLTSASVKDRQKGMENVASLLPFLLLGGFTDVETLSYIKAKLEAARLTLEEMDQVTKAKEEVKKEEEELVSIPVIEKQEEKEMELSAQKEMPVPDSSELPGFYEEETNEQPNNKQKSNEQKPKEDSPKP